VAERWVERPIAVVRSDHDWDRVAPRDVADLGMSSADDSDIRAWCREHGAVAVALDADFHAAMRRPCAW
jgi:predicted nuclease of predicted toxin-antitoxin system